MPITMLAVAAGTLLNGCGPLDHSHWANGHLAGHKTFGLDLVYGGNASTLAAAAYADVADGTAGTVELTGAEHWRCQGQFRAQPNSGLLPWDVEKLPAFTTPDGTPVVNFSVPPGSYTVTVRIPALQAELKESATLDRGRHSDARTGYSHDEGCFLVADTLAQQKAFITEYLDGMQRIARELGKSDLRSLVDQARQQYASANESADPAVIGTRYSLVAKSLGELKDAARADFPKLPPFALLQAADDTIALLSQSGLH